MKLSHFASRSDGAKTWLVQLRNCLRAEETRCHQALEIMMKWCYLHQCKEWLHGRLGWMKCSALMFMDTDKRCGINHINPWKLSAVVPWWWQWSLIDRLVKWGSVWSGRWGSRRKISWLMSLSGCSNNVQNLSWWDFGKEVWSWHIFLSSALELGMWFWEWQGS